MPSSSTYRTLALLLAFAVVPACTSDSATGTAADAGADSSDAGSPDGTDAPDAPDGTDAGPDAATTNDATTEAAAPDGGMDPPDGTVAWVLSYFGPSQTVASDSLHLAYSKDGLHWTALEGGLPAYQIAGIGSDHIRDPFIIRKPNGTFVYIATDWTLSVNDSNYWNHPSSKIFVAESNDLITFTNPHLLTVTNLPGPGGSQMHAWAPEVYFDRVRNKYAIVWSGNDSSGRSRTYLSYTTDFQSVDNVTPTVLFDPGYDVIDATVTVWNGQSYLFFKDETDNSGSPLTGSGKDIQIARAATTDLGTAGFSRWSAHYVTRGASQTIRQATEGPFVIKDPSQARWYLFADFYTAGGVFGAWTTTDLDADPASWTALPASAYSFPPGVRHANTVRVTQAQLDALIAATAPTNKLRSTYSEGGKSFYVSHSYYHGQIVTLGNPGLNASDQVWQLRPGLADENDASLVSFQASALVGRYLRIDSGNVNRYPACNDGSVYGSALCNVAAADRNHLVWLDTQAETSTFRADATFKRVPALNGDPQMVSFQWMGDLTTARYLRHMNYQLFATPIDGSATQNTDASFTIE